MTPVTFHGCFGWLHRGSGTTGTTGIVLCSAFGHENMNTHRGWLVLAERLAARGLHVIRFDYPGTGDSSGSDADPDRIAAWQGGISAAVDLLRSATDTDRVILIGLRLGATLALMASGGIDRVEAVACLAPVVSGRHHQRELRLLANAWREANHLALEQQPDGNLDVVGERWTSQTLRSLSAIDLRSLPVRVPQMLLMQDADGPMAADLEAHLIEQGCSVTTAEFPGGSEYLQDSLSSRVPEAAFDALLEWCAARREVPRAPGPVLLIRQPTATVLRLPDATEAPFQFGPAGNLFGILCSPDRFVAAAPTIIMLNTGFGRHIGDGRVLVTLARRLASMGVASLRMDIAGFGDSRALGGAEPDPYSNDASADVAAAVDALEQAGHGRPFLIGICSGAYSAFHSALNDARIRGLILVNIQKFVWKIGTSLKAENDRQRRPFGFYVRSVARAKAWQRFIRGDVNVAAILIAMLRRWLSRVHHGTCLFLEKIFRIETRSGQVMRHLQALNSREVDVNLLYGDADPGLSELTYQFQRNHRGLREMSHVRVELLSKADHALLDRTARRQFIETSCRIIRRHIERRRDHDDAEAAATRATVPSPTERSRSSCDAGTG